MEVNTNPNDGTSAPVDPAAPVVPGASEAPQADPAGESTAPLDAGKRRAIDDMLKYKAVAKAAEEKLKKIEEDQLRKTQQWQQLAERKAQEAESLSEQLAAQKKAIENHNRYQAVRTEAIKAGIINDQDIELIDLSDVEIETTSTGRVNVIGAAQAVAGMKTLRPHWFRAPAANVNPTSPGVNHATSSSNNAKDIFALEAEARKTGDWTKVKAAMAAFKR